MELLDENFLVKLLDVLEYLVQHSLIHPFVKDLMNDQVNLYLMNDLNQDQVLIEIVMWLKMVVALEVGVVKENQVVKIVDDLEMLD
jgi:hypothetical protein